MNRVAGGNSSERLGHAALDLSTRDCKARKIEALLRIEPRKEVLRVLEIGTGSGGIAHYFGTHPSLSCKVDAVDVRDTRQTCDGYQFTKVDGVTLPFEDHLYDIVISNHVIEHVGETEAQALHLAEIRRVLNPEGLGYLAVPNRWQVTEPHFRVPFLSWLPESWRTPYLRLFRPGNVYDCRPLTVSSLERLLSEAGFRFRQEHGGALRLTFEIERPRAFIYRALLKRLPDGLYQSFRRAFPTLIYILQAPSRESG